MPRTRRSASAFWDAEMRYRRVNAELGAINGLPAEAHNGRCRWWASKCPGERVAQRGDLLAQLPPRQVREDLRVGLACDQRVEHVTPGLAHDVRRDGVELDVASVHAGPDVAKRRPSDTPTKPLTISPKTPLHATRVRRRRHGWTRIATAASASITAIPTSEVAGPRSVVSSTCSASAPTPAR